MATRVYTPRALAPKAALRHMRVMSLGQKLGHLQTRAVIAVTGDDWRGFLQGLVTQDVETLAAGELRFAALLTPQGRVLFDLFLLGRDNGCWIDCDAARRADLLARLTIYRLRAKVKIEAIEVPIFAGWGSAAAPVGWIRDPRLAELGFRHYGELAGDSVMSSEADYDGHCLGLGVPGPEDWGVDKTYPIEANFDLLNGIDFQKGCFVGQETTSRMKRRGLIKSRMAPVAYDGPRPERGAELLAGELRAGEVLSVGDGLAMALLRLDRVGSGALGYGEGGAWRPVLPDWIEATLAPA